LRLCRAKDMNMKTLMLAIVVTAAVCGASRLARSGAADARAASDATAAHHLVVRPEQVDWRDGPPSLPPGAKFVVLEGDPAKEGFFAMRAKMPDGFRVPPHWHPGVERITVLAGTFHLGNGEKFDRAATQALPAGTYSAMQPGMRHFGWAEGETIIQVTTNGPWGINYVNPADDPRKSDKGSK
jgi:hypothetical protein